jgi:hypothetical protein
MNLSNLYYVIKPAIPRSVQIWLRACIVNKKLNKVKDIWPIKKDANIKPDEWNGWPDGKKSVLILTHDVESSAGLGKAAELAAIEKKMDLYSSFNIVPERYEVSETKLGQLKDLGFEIGVHDLNHDGKLFSSYKIFSQRAKKINWYLKKWNACGFRAGSMLHNLDWISELDISYDCSTFDTDPFEPQPDGIGTIFPIVVKRKFTEGTFIELPYTMPQDFLLFILMKHRDIDVWKKKVDWIIENNGMILINTHPDYMNMQNEYTYNEYPVQNYIRLLEYINNKYCCKFLNLLPKELSAYVNNIELQVN